jgi:acetyl-CoA carboxylase carboxyl transferase subunit beta
MAWFRKEKEPLKAAEGERLKTEGLWIKCDSCRAIIWKKDLDANWNVCPKCSHHFRIDARTRLRLLLDDENYTVHDAEVETADPLAFVDLKSYTNRVAAAQRTTRLKDAILMLICSMEYGFIGGSMGGVVGEVITRAAERALASRIPLIIVSASGGARMMEGTVSLMQMAKVSAALARMDSAGIPYISLLTDPTTGGVTASFSMLGDLNIAEPGALIGFAGPRVIEQTIRQKLPPGFQRSEFLLTHGMLDAVVSRHELKQYIVRALKFFVG